MNRYKKYDKPIAGHDRATISMAKARAVWASPWKPGSSDGRTTKRNHPRMKNTQMWRFTINITTNRELDKQSEAIYPRAGPIISGGGQ